MHWLSLNHTTHRNRVSLLGLQNIYFKHAMLLKIHLQGCLKSLASHKLFSSYCHSLIIRAPQQYRLVSGRTSNTKSEEATLNAIKVATNLTSNHHPPNVIVNALIRLQAKDQLNENQLTPEKESNLNYMYNTIKHQFKNTIISFDWVKKYRRQYQCLLKRQADYLTDKRKLWIESREGIELFDLNESPTNSKLLLSNFRLSNIKRELTGVNNCWLKALQNRDKLIPAYSIEIDSGENDTQPILLTALDHLKNGPQKIADPDTNPQFINHNTGYFECCSSKLFNSRKYIHCIATRVSWGPRSFPNMLTTAKYWLFLWK